MEQILANIIAIFHGIFIFLLIAGVIFSLSGKLKNKFLRNAFITGMVLTAASFLVFGGCFLTTIEQDLRAAAGGGYEGGFISHYLGEVGINISDIAVFFFLTSLITAGVFSEIYHNRNVLSKIFGKILKVKQN